MTGVASLSTGDIALEKLLDQEKARNGPPEHFPDIPEIPGLRYTKPEFLELEQRHIFKNMWLCIGDTEGVRQPGEYRLFTASGAPILVVRGKDGVLRAFYNTCRHRGAPVVRETAGQAKLLRCQYHSWAYGLDGKLVAVPDERDFTCFDKSKRGLIELQCEEWAGLAFVNENSSSEPLSDHLQPLLADLAWFEEAKLRVVHRETYVMDCNWKAALDAFVEVYHVNTIHPGTGSIVFDSRASLIELLSNGHSRTAMRRTEEGLRRQEAVKTPWIPDLPDLYVRNSLSYTLFPNVVLLVEPTGVFLQMFWPVGTGKVRLDTVFFGPDWGDEPRPKFWDSYVKIIDQVVHEDIQNLAPMQFSMESGAFTGVLTNCQERRIYWFHEEVDRRIGSKDLPPEFAVKQIFPPYSAPFPIPHSQ